MNTNRSNWFRSPINQRINRLIDFKILFLMISIVLFYPPNLIISMPVILLYRLEKKRWNTSFVHHLFLIVTVRRVLKTTSKEKSFEFSSRSVDFWQMIVEQRVGCLVGIFSEQDLKKMKCPTYWPTTIKSAMKISPL